MMLIRWRWQKWLKNKNTSLIKKKWIAKRTALSFSSLGLPDLLSLDALSCFTSSYKSRRRSTTYWHWDEDATKTRTLPRFHQYLHKPPLFFLSSYLFQGSAMKNNLIFLSQLSKVVSRVNRREFSPFLTGHDQRASMSVLPTHTLL